jgi:hypothetical protein
MRWAKLENPYPDELQQKVSSKQEQEILAKTEQARDLIPSELWVLENAAHAS